MHYIPATCQVICLVAEDEAHADYVSEWCSWSHARVVLALCLLDPMRISLAVKTSRKRGGTCQTAPCGGSIEKGSCKTSALVAPYCTIPRDYLSDTPHIVRYGVFGAGHVIDQFGAITPSLFFELSPLESMRSGGAIPPPPPDKMGYLSDTCAIPHENKAKWVRDPLCDTISKRYCAIWGGVSHWAAKDTTSEAPFASLWSACAGCGTNTRHLAVHAR